MPSGCIASMPDLQVKPVEAPKPKPGPQDKQVKAKGKDGQKPVEKEKEPRVAGIKAL